MICPRCKTSSDILSYIRLQEIEEFSNETTPIYKCGICKWMFAPADVMPQDIYKDLSEKVEFLFQHLQKKDCDCKT